VSLSPIQAAFCLSLLIHAAVLWFRFPHFLELPGPTPPRKDSQIQLDVFLAPQTERQPAAPAFALPQPDRPAKSPQRILQGTAAAKESVRLPRADPAPAAQSKIESDAERSPVQESRPKLDLYALRQQGVAAYFSAGRESNLAAESVHRGGIFRIKRLDGDEYAELYYAGWNADAGRNATLLYPVSKGNNANIRVAMVRRAIRIIRDQWTGDFEWASKRLGRNVTLSARPADSAALEEFLLLEFFVGDKPAQWDGPR
jgi:hypothetical protein